MFLLQIHTYFYLLPLALQEFKRCLKPGGYAVVFVPDLEGVHATEDVLIEAPCGPISGLDMIYGYARALREGNLFMAHKCGFVVVRDLFKVLVFVPRHFFLVVVAT